VHGRASASKRPALPALLAGTVLVFTSTAVLASDYRIGPKPSWAQPLGLKLTSNKKKGTIVDGIDYLLSDIQVRVNGANKQRYVHIASQAANTNGIEDLANISISFDPTYQKLTLHSLKLRRKGKVFSVMKKAQMKILQREKELEYQVYDGTKTLNILIPDVRSGDIVEYSYTREGSNPVFAGSFHDGIDTQWGVPVGQMQYRLLWPPHRKLGIRNNNTTLNPVVRNVGGYKEYTWAEQNVPAQNVDNALPRWYDPFPWIQLSESQSWSQVAGWARTLFEPNGDEAQSPVIRSALDKITQATTTEQRLLDILRFVQEDIRYLGIEIGRNSHAPTDPGKVLARRYGDCKDKARLAADLLRAAGIEAWPALVNTRIRQGVADYLPTRSIFDHAIVYARVNGKDYWLDPTRKNQRGSIDKLYQPNYGSALVLNGRTIGLKAMQQDKDQPHTKTIRETIDLRAETKKPATYNIVSEFDGYYADDMRETLATRSHERLQKDYSNYYADTYPKIQPARDLETFDDTKRNRVVVKEFYKVPDIWVPNEKDQTDNVVFYPSLLTDSIKKPSSPQRTMPLRVNYPVDYRQVTKIMLSGDWALKDEEQTIRDPVFVFKRRITYKNDTLTLDYDFRTLKDSVEAKRMGEYVANIDKVRDLLGYEIYMPRHALAKSGSKPGSDMNWKILFIYVMAMLVVCVLAWLTYRYDPPYIRKEPVDEKLSGLGGWLILPALGLVLTPIRLLFEMRDYIYVFSLKSWNQVLATDGISPWFQEIAITELILNSAMILFGLVLVVEFFQKRHTLPKLYIAVTAFSVAYLLIDMYLAGVIKEGENLYTDNDRVEVMRAMFGALIWIWYFSVSRRVRSTFVNRLSGTSPEVATASS